MIISNPGGDRIGRRPVDLHVEAMRTLGATIEYRNGYYFATAPGRLRGTEIRFPFVSVMGTENAMLAATLADGHTVIRPAAREPEVDDLIAFLRKMGAEVERTYPDTIEVDGKRRLRGAEHHVDRRTGSRPGRSSIAARRDRRPGHADRRAVRPDDRLARGRSGGRASTSTCDGERIEVDGRGARTAASGPATSRPRPYPGLATDLQSPTRVLLTQAEGTSHVHEAIFEDRLEWLVGAAPDGRRRSTSPTITTPRSTAARRCAARTSRSATSAPARR